MKEGDLGQKSLPRNPLLFGLFYRMDLVEQIGSGVMRIRDLCRDYGVPEPTFDVSENWVTVAFPRTVHGRIPEVTPEVTPEVARMLSVMRGEMSRTEIQAELGLKDEKHFRENYQQVAVECGLIEMTIPEKPNSRLQKYRLTDKGRAWLKKARQ